MYKQIWTVPLLKIIMNKIIQIGKTQLKKFDPLNDHYI